MYHEIYPSAISLAAMKFEASS